MLAAPGTPSTPLPASPTSTFPYRILAKVGEGAMGEVYRAQDVELGRPVAIKVVKPGFLSALSERDAQDALQRFTQEARAAAALSHPGVTTVHRVGSESGWPYIAMEWIDGTTLEEVLASQGRLPLDRAARIGLQVLSVLDAAHRAGIVHRDIKPGNVMVTRDRRVKVTDFGVARVPGPAAAQTQLGFVLGTPLYAAPEQLAGRAVDGRADLYSVGAVVYEAVVGRPPIEATSALDLLRQVQTARPRPAGATVPGLPPSFDTFLSRALAKEPADRFASAAEMGRALQPFLTAPRPASPPTQALFASAPPPVPVPVVRAEGDSAGALVAATVRDWPARPLGRRRLAALLERLLEKPLHAPAFSGALEVAGALLLVHDGVVFAAFDPSTGRSGDAVVEALPAEVEATLHSCPPGLEPRVVTLLAGLTAPGAARLSGLDAAFVDVPQLAAKLAQEGFDGALRLVSGQRLGFVLFSRGRQVLTVFGPGWPAEAPGARWEQWIPKVGATASIEDRRTSFPSMTFRRLLRGVEVDVVRPRREEASSVRSDTRATLEALELRPRAASLLPVRAESARQALLEADPALGLARWLLVDLGAQFEQFRRASRWRAMLEPLPWIDTVTLHASPIPGDAGAPAFDVATFAAGRLRHLADRVAHGTKEAVLDFVARVTAVKRSGGPGRSLAGAVLVAPSFSEQALEAYLAALRGAAGPLLRTALELWSHREGLLAMDGGGLHLLLVEEQGGRRRPLVTEE